MREKYGILIGALTLIFVLSPKIITLFGIFLLSFFASKELKTSLSLRIFPYFSLIVLTGAIFDITLGIFLAFLISFFEGYKFFDEKVIFESLFLSFYTGIVPSYIFYVKALDHFLLLKLLIMVWVFDTMSYYVGKSFGKRKLIRISPGKTYEGFFGGLLSLVFASVLMFGLSGIFLAIVMGPVFLFGDLYKSIFKRIAGIKDFSNIFGEHGGVLDRFDALLMGSLVFYLLVKSFILYNS